MNYINAICKSYHATYLSYTNSVYYKKKIKGKGGTYNETNIKNNIKKAARKKNIVLDKAKVLWVGACKSQDESGWLQALGENVDLDIFYNANNEYGLETPGRWRNQDLIERNGNKLVELVEKNNYKIVIGQFWPNFICLKALSYIKEKGVFVINIAMDDRLPYHWKKYKHGYKGAIGLVDGVDLVLNTSEEMCQRYWANNCDCLYWPLGSDPEIFRPSKSKDIDIAFVGNRYGIRKTYIDYLIDNGIDVSAYGNGWENGYIQSNKIADVFSRSKIILGIGYVGYNKDIVTLKLRDFDATMSGALYLTTYNKDLSKLFIEDKEIVFYRSKSEMLDKAKYFLKNPNEAEEIAVSGMNKCRTLYAWDLRVKEILDYIKT